jgi:hypothetical protein
MRAFHVTEDSSHRTGTPFACACPSPRGPRNCVQPSSALLDTSLIERHTTNNQVDKRFIFLFLEIHIDGDAIDFFAILSAKFPSDCTAAFRGTKSRSHLLLDELDRALFIAERGKYGSSEHKNGHAWRSGKFKLQAGLSLSP